MGIKRIALPVDKFGGRLGMMVQTDVLGVVTSVKQLMVARGIDTAAQYDRTVAIR